jgi:hypothetical protein
LPTQGSDVDKWGEVLNEFLLTEHNIDGTLKLSGTLSTKYTLPTSGIPKSHLSSSVQASLAKADAAITSIPVITKDDVGLSRVTNDAQLPLTGGTVTGNLGVRGITSITGTAVITAGAANNVPLQLIGAAGQTANYFEIKDASNALLFSLNKNGSFLGRTFIPTTHNAYTLGSTSLYWSNTYSSRYYLNPTAYLDGAAAGAIGISDGTNLTFGTATGTRIGTGTTQKIGFFGAVPVGRQNGGASTASTTYGSNEQAMMNAMWIALRNLGLIS